MLEHFKKYQLQRKRTVLGGESGNFITTQNQHPPSAPIFSSSTAGNISDDDE